MEGTDRASEGEGELKENATAGQAQPVKVPFQYTNKALRFPPSFSVIFFSILKGVEDCAFYTVAKQVEL